MQTGRIKQEARAALAEFLACVFFVFFGAGSVVGAISATSDAGVVEHTSKKTENVILPARLHQ